jgi:signal transduction histidine kinase
VSSYLKNMQLHPELTINVARNNNLAVFATICGTIFIFQNLFTVVPSSILGTWVVLQILVSLFRLGIGYKLLKYEEESPQWKRATRLFIVSTSLVGFGLGFSAVMAEIYGSVEEQLFIFAILIGFAGGAVATLSPVIHGYIAHVFGIMVPQILVLFLSFGEADLFDSEGLEVLIGYLGLLYMIIVVRAGMILHNTFYESIQLKTELAAAKDLAESANQAKSKFLSSISHELRTPLHAIMGSSQLLEIDEKDEDKKEFISLIKQAGQHLLALIDQILEFAKIEAGKMKLDISEVNLGNLLQECGELVQSLSVKHGINLDIQVPDEKVIFNSDPLRIKQIILNLISNAIKYNKPDGMVTVSVSQLKSDRIRINVKDTGFGIPENRQSELFVVFNRLGRESGDQEGTGIGLAICRELITTMGGIIDFESIEDEGSLFWIEIDTEFYNNNQDIEL